MLTQERSFYSHLLCFIRRVSTGTVRKKFNWSFGNRKTQVQSPKPKVDSNRPKSSLPPPPTHLNVDQVMWHKFLETYLYTPVNIFQALLKSMLRLMISESWAEKPLTPKQGKHFEGESMHFMQFAASLVQLVEKPHPPPPNRENFWNVDLLHAISSIFGSSGRKAPPPPLQPTRKFFWRWMVKSLLIHYANHFDVLHWQIASLHNVKSYLFIKKSKKRYEFGGWHFEPILSCNNEVPNALLLKVELYMVENFVIDLRVGVGGPLVNALDTKIVILVIFLWSFVCGI